MNALAKFGIVYAILTQSTLVIADARHDIANDAINCSALFYIYASVEEINPPFGTAMRALQDTLDYVYSVHKTNESGKRVTKKIVSHAKSNEIINIGAQFDKNPLTIYDKYEFCNSWRAKWAPYLLEAGVDSRRMTEDEGRQIILNMPPAPYQSKASAELIAKIKPITEMAFKTWVEMGRITPDMVGDVLRAIANDASDR